MIEYYETIYTLSQIYIQFPKLQLENWRIRQTSQMGAGENDDWHSNIQIPT